jgi:hypothetical protein
MVTFSKDLMKVSFHVTCLRWVTSASLQLVQTCWGSKAFPSFINLATNVFRLDF